MNEEVLKSFGVALALGGLIGLERERSKSVENQSNGKEVDLGSFEKSVPEFAGIRTFPLMALCGALSAHLTTWLGPAIFIVAFGVFTILVATAYHVIASRGEDQGLTTAVSALLVFGLSGLCRFESVELCAALGISIYLLLALKQPLRSLARRIDVEDVHAIGKFGALILLVLPLLPDRGYGPFQVLNPRQIGLLATLIAAISLGGFLLVKMLGPQRGFGLTGVLGGLVSSTAVTLSFSQKSRQFPALAIPSALAIVLACTTMTGRILVVTSVVNSRMLSWLWMPMASMGIVGLGASAILYQRARKVQADGHAIDLKNPFELRPAIQFAGLFAGVLLLATTLQHVMGKAGIYLSGLLAGLTDVDAIVLSMGKLSADEHFPLQGAAITIVLAASSNTLVKAFLALGLADRTTGRWVFGTLLAQAAIGISGILLLAY